jgi:hypothetical protein
MTSGPSILTAGGIGQDYHCSNHQPLKWRREAEGSGAEG